MPGLHVALGGDDLDAGGVGAAVLLQQVAADLGGHQPQHQRNHQRNGSLQFHGLLRQHARSITDAVSTPSASPHTP